MTCSCGHAAADHTRGLGCRVRVSEWVIDPDTGKIVETLPYYDCPCLDYTSEVEL